jgi:D-alanyl-D-alanine carboxypeptidase
VKRGKVDQVALVASDAARVTVARGKEKSVSVIPELPPAVVAPVAKGQVAAKVLVQKEGKTVKEINLLSAANVEKSLIPPWPVLVGIAVGLCLVGGGGVLWLRRSQAKKYG